MKAVLFDINETTLDLAVLAPRFSKLFGSQEALQVWFARLLHASTVSVLTQLGSDFRSLARDELEKLAHERAIALSEPAASELLSSFASLPAHPDIKEGLETLRAQGFETVAFSNSSSALLAAQLKHAKLPFQRIVSVEEAKTFKPDPRAYHFAARQLGIEPAQAWMVAAHDWDIHGALHAGFRGAYLVRGRRSYHPQYLQPQLSSDSLAELITSIVAEG